MKTVSMSGSLRENVGKKDAKKLRREGRVPCVLYGGEKQIGFSMPEVDFKHLIFTPEVKLVDLNIDGKQYKASLQDVQYHPVTDHILHVDFLEVTAGKALVIGVPVRITGVSKGVLQGGKLVQKVRKLKVKAFAEHLPDDIPVDITELDIAQAIKVQDVKMEHLQMLDNPASIIVTVAATRAVADDKKAAPAK
ncbi:MAG TPA: 50S ribosomal protein L25/general stress protein Ctc [Bacteroidales bacterium]|nr:50S ribosomal protein L25/general stress protein Ctc [Bacteroidales bacterium]HSA44859.1 50S ribosomal protein L25/general stress protein Ctc [Bacteroidales bacterium]